MVCCQQLGPGLYWESFMPHSGQRRTEGASGSGEGPIETFSSAGLPLATLPTPKPPDGRLWKRTTFRRARRKPTFEVMIALLSSPSGGGAERWPPRWE